MRAAFVAAAGAHYRAKASFSDSFNRANEILGAPNWSVITSGLTVTGNRVQGSGRVVWNADTVTDDQYTQVTVANVAAGTIYLWLRNPGGTGWPRVDAFVTPSSGAWGILTDPSSAAGNHTNRVTGSLGSGVVVATDVLRFEVVGNVYVLYRNGEVSRLRGGWIPGTSSCLARPNARSAFSWTTQARWLSMTGPAEISKPHERTPICLLEHVCREAAPSHPLSCRRRTSVMTSTEPMRRWVRSRFLHRTGWPSPRG